jgi:adenylate cyclase
VHEAGGRARAANRMALLIALATNIGGAVFVTIYVGVIFPGSTHIGIEDGEINVALVVAYVLSVLALAIPYNILTLRRGLRWVGEARRPSATERWIVLTHPVRQSVSAFLAWLGAAVIFGVLLQGTPESRTQVAVGVVVAGLFTCALQELLLDKSFRPLFALVLDEARLPRWRRELLTRVMVGWLLGSAVPLLAVGLAPLFVPAEDLTQGDTKFRLVFAVVTACLAGGLVMRGAAGAVSEPLNDVTDTLARVEDGDLEVHVDVTHIGEIGRLQQSVNDMVSGLRDRRAVRDLFGRQVGLDPGDVSDGLIPRLGGEGREITALFVDLDGFTAYTLDHTPDEVVTELNAFFAVVIGVVTGEGGWVNKFEGDAALCIFGAPRQLEDHAARALRAAAALPGALAAQPEQFRVGIGVATGLVVVGNVGTAERHEFTVIGDAVNVAARLTELAKRSYGGVLASQETIVAAGETDAGWREVGTETLRGRSKPTRLFEPEALPRRPA